MAIDCKGEQPPDAIWERTMLLHDVQGAFENNVAQTALSVNAELDALIVLHGDIIIPDQETTTPSAHLGITLVQLLNSETADIVQVRVRGVGGDPRTQHIDYNLRPTLESLQSQLTIEDAYRDALFRRMLELAHFRMEASHVLLAQYLEMPSKLGKTIGTCLLETV